MKPTKKEGVCKVEGALARIMYEAIDISLSLRAAHHWLTGKPLEDGELESWCMMVKLLPAAIERRVGKHWDDR